jgi:hypothetical protein
MPSNNYHLSINNEQYCFIKPEGYILDEAPKTIVVTSGKLTTVEFLNKPLSGLRIIKLDSTTY